MNKKKEISKLYEKFCHFKHFFKQTNKILVKLHTLLFRSVSKFFKSLLQSVELSSCDFSGNCEKKAKYIELVELSSCDLSESCVRLVVTFVRISHN